MASTSLDACSNEEKHFVDFIGLHYAINIYHWQYILRAETRAAL